MIRFAMSVFVLLVLSNLPCWSQTVTGDAETDGVCSPAVTGGTNTFTINCAVNQKDGKKILDMLNKVLAKQADLDVVNTKLDEILKALPSGQGEKNSVQLQSALQKVLDFPEAVQDSAPPKTLVEAMLTNQTPRKIFDILMQYDTSTIGAVRSGSTLRDFIQRYYRFQTDEIQFENGLLQRIGTMVAVRFPAGWLIYLKYAILRFSGKSKEGVIAEGNFLNYDITWDDAERVYSQLSADQLVSNKFANTFSQYRGFIGETNQLKLVQPGP